MTMQELVAQIRQTQGCVVLPAAGLPSVSAELPADLTAFYQACGGATLFQGRDYPITIVSPGQFRPANLEIAGLTDPEDISDRWYIVAEDAQHQQYITFDLGAERLGRCYDSYWDRHAVAGSCPIIAWNFTSLIEQLLRSQGIYWYWLQDDFTAMGDAYDDVTS